MAGDWIKIEHAMPDKPEVVQMATHLKIDQDAVSGKCLRLWIWADQQSVDGHALSVTDSFVNRLTHCDGFAVALRKVGWLDGRDGRLSIPNFSRHNGQPAKKRALQNDRKKASRSKRDQPSRAERDKSVTREEKRREENYGYTQVEFPSNLDTPAFRDLFAQWASVRADKHVDSLNDIQAAQVLQKLTRWGYDGAVRALEAAIVGGWKSIRKVEPDDTKQPRRAGSRAEQQEQSNADAFTALGLNGG